MNEIEMIGHLLAKSHQVLYFLFGYFVFSNAVGAMAAPTDKSSVAYRYAFAFLHGLAGNIKYAISKVAPGVVKPE